MVNRATRTISRVNSGVNPGVASFIAVVLVYTCFTVYLYRPYFEKFDRWQYLLVITAPVGSLGCYVLSRRWVAGFFESLFAGAVYGFGPFALGLARFHPSAGLLIAAVPWLFCPAAFCSRIKGRWSRYAGVPLSLLPFLGVVLYFQAAAHYHLYPIPIQLKLSPTDVIGLLTPYVAARRGMTLIGFYHVLVAALVIGISMLLAARRLGVIVVFVVGMVLVFCRPVFDVSPIIWLVVPVLCCSVLIGAGVQGFDRAGYSDRKWIMANVVIMGVLAILMLLLATKYFQVFFSLADGYARLFAESAKMYVLGAVLMGILYILMTAKLQLHRLWSWMFYAALGLDIFLGARFIVDTIF